MQGLPFPSQEQNAIDAVMQYAIHNLGFQPENIIVYAWSIGGYAGTWAAMNYPNVSQLLTIFNIINRDQIICSQNYLLGITSYLPYPNNLSFTSN